jgi:hypothetical protein
MIKAIWGLKLEGALLGVRVQTTYNNYYDIDIDVYKKQLKLDPSSLVSLPLMEYGDMFMTEEEFNSGLLVEDGSADLKLHSAIKVFVAESNVTDPQYQYKRRKKVEELSQKYFSYMPNKWLKEFAEYHIDNFDGNDNIYNTLNEAQRTIVKDYFRWRSRLFFEEQKASKVLRTKPTKTRELVSLMGNSNDWYYDGTVDTGYKGASHCELGHPLRYEHYAFSPSLNKQIIFGSTCMSDFFELDEKVIRQITQAQEILLKELKSIVFIKQTDKSDEYLEPAKELWDVMKHFKGRFTKFANGAGWSRFIGGFARLNLPLTRSMMQMYHKMLGVYLRELEDGIEEEVKPPVSQPKPEAPKTEAPKPEAPKPEAPKPEAPKMEVDYDDDQLTAIEEAASEGRLPKSHFALTVIPTIRRMGRMTEKQRKYIDDALSKIEDEQPF